MKNEVIVAAKTLDEAIMKGCEELGGVGLDEVDFQVEEEGGLFRKMKVKVSLKAATKPETKPAVQPEPQVTDDATPDVEEFEIVGKGSKPRKTEVELAQEQDKKAKQRPVTEFDENCPKFKKTREFAEQLFALLGDDLKVTTDHNDQEFIIAVDGPDVGRLIGKSGHTLAAINVIVASIAVNTHCGEPRRVIVDVANYREQRKANLIALAQRKAEQVKERGRAIRLDPMPARERVIVHLALQDVEGITTESEGVEPHRYLVIKPDAR